MKPSGGPENRAPVVKDPVVVKTATWVSPGQQLRRAREAAGYSETYVAQQLRLSASVIKAIDTDNYSFGARLLYLKGYLKAYAKLVGLSPHDILTAFGQLEVPEPPAIYPEIPLFQRLPGRFNRYSLIPKWVWPVMMLIVVSLAIAWWHTHEFKRHLNLDAALNIDTLHPVHATPIEAIDTRVPAATPMPLKKVVNDSVVLNNLPETTPAALPSATLARPKLAFDADSVKHLPLPVTLEFKDSCWVKAVDAAGSELFKGLKQAGQQLRLTGVAPVTLTLGNAHAVEVHYDGGLVDLSVYPPQQIAHLQLGQAAETG